MGREEGVTAGIRWFKGELMVGKMLEEDESRRELEKKKGKNSSRVLLRGNWRIDGQIKRKKGSVARTKVNCK